MARYIFVVGGVMSGIGKGIATASIGRILKNYGYKVTAIKIDPYINVDAGTMNPVEHGEVFVTEDGIECDQDIGNYERFLDQNMYGANYMTTGLVYQSVISRERNLEYGGKCVEVVPHIPEEVIRRIEGAGKKAKADFVLIEIGGTVGEYQNLLFLEAGRMLRLKKPGRVLFAIVSYLPVPDMIGEMKTKPTQYAVRSLNTAGIQPDIIIARSSVPLDQPRKDKIAVFCNIDPLDVISAPDVKNIYDVPINFEKENMGARILQKFGLLSPGMAAKSAKGKPKEMAEWSRFRDRVQRIKKKVKIGIVGKYFSSGKFTLADSYISVIEAVKHAAWHCGYQAEIHWIDSEKYEKKKAATKELLKYDGIIVPGGFGSRGIEGKIASIGFARKNKIPFLGLCYGMQLAVIEACRSLLGLNGSHTTEVDPRTKHPVISLLPEQEINLKNHNFGGSMRLGGYTCELQKNTLSLGAYGERNIIERHRHRYEFNNDFRDQLAAKGVRFAGFNPQRNLVEIIEIVDHPFFVGTQFHPEFKSRPLRPHPLFREFLKAAVKRRIKRRR